MSFWDENRTKVLGYSIAGAGFITTTIAAGTFKDLLEPSTIQWLGIICGFVITVFGGGTAAVGHSNTTRERVAAAAATVAVAEAHTAEVIQTALNTPPPGDKG